MTFADLSAGESIFLDANPLVYHFAPDPLFGPACNQLIARVENGDTHAFTSIYALSEVAHKAWKATRMAISYVPRTSARPTLPHLPPR